MSFPSFLQLSLVTLGGRGRPQPGVLARKGREAWENLPFCPTQSPWAACVCVCVWHGRPLCARSPCSRTTKICTRVPASDHEPRRRASPRAREHPPRSDASEPTFLDFPHLDLQSAGSDRLRATSPSKEKKKALCFSTRTCVSPLVFEQKVWHVRFPLDVMLLALRVSGDS